MKHHSFVPYPYRSIHSTTAVLLGILLSVAWCPVQAQMLAPIIRSGTVKTADGQLLRGCHAHIGRSMTTEVKEYFTHMENVVKLRDEAHLNTIRIAVMAPGWGGYETVEEGLPYVDAIVANCEAAGIYAIINYHGPVIYDGYSSMDIRNMWDTYAPRYKDKPFVMYGIHNENTQGSPPGGSAQDWPTDQKVDLYKNHVRKWAPDNLVMGHHEPVNISDNWGPYMRDVFGPAAGIDWSAGKDAFSFHMYGGEPQHVRATQAAGIPVMISEYSFFEEGWWSNEWEGTHMVAEWAEANDVSWCVWQEWQSRNADQLESVMIYLIPDAVDKDYVWWDGTEAVNIPTPIRALASGATITRIVQPNGRTIGIRQEGNVPVELSILPRSLLVGR